MVTKRYRLGHLGSASLVSLAHGTNDAQKTRGVITLALVAHCFALVARADLRRQWSLAAVGPAGCLAAVAVGLFAMLHK